MIVKRFNPAGALRLIVPVIALAAACAERGTELAAPVVEKRPVEITPHGRTRVDDYAWLEDEDWRTVLRDPSTLDAELAHLYAFALEVLGRADVEPVGHPPRRRTHTAEVRRDL